MRQLKQSNITGREVKDHIKSSGLDVLSVSKQVFGYGFDNNNNKKYIATAIKNIPTKTLLHVVFSLSGDNTFTLISVLESTVVHIGMDAEVLDNLRIFSGHSNKTIAVVYDTNVNLDHSRGEVCIFIRHQEENHYTDSPFNYRCYKVSRIANRLLCSGSLVGASVVQITDSRIALLLKNELRIDIKPSIYGNIVNRFYIETQDTYDI